MTVSLLVKGNGTSPLPRHTFEIETEMLETNNMKALMPVGIGKIDNSRLFEFINFPDDTADGLSEHSKILEAESNKILSR